MTDLIIPDIKNDDEWHAIIDKMVETIEESDRDLPDKAVEAAELMVAGWPTYKIARQLKVKTKTVKGWLDKFPVMALAVAAAKNDIQKWRLSQMEQQFVTAVKKSAEVLTAETVVIYDEFGKPVTDDDGNVLTIDPNAKLLGVQAQHARYILSLFLGNKIDLNVTVRDETPVMRARKDAMDYVAKKIASLVNNQEPRETVVIVQKPDDESGPLLTEDDEPRFGTMGIIHTNDEGSQCHICGKRFRQLEIHVRTKHKISNDHYESVFMLPPGALRHERTESPGDGGPSET